MTIQIPSKSKIVGLSSPLSHIVELYHEMGLVVLPFFLTLWDGHASCAIKFLVRDGPPFVPNRNTGVSQVDGGDRPIWLSLLQNSAAQLHEPRSLEGERSR